MFRPSRRNINRRSSLVFSSRKIARRPPPPPAGSRRVSTQHRRPSYSSRRTSFSTHRWSRSASYARSSMRTITAGWTRPHSRPQSRNSVSSARSRSRSESPLFPTTHYRKSVRAHGKVNRNNVPAHYNVNREIANLAAQFTQSRRNRQLPPIDIPSTNGSPQWPLHIPVYVISIDSIRQRNFQQRFAHNSTIWSGTHGRTMDLTQLRHSGRLVSNQLTRGEIGCYDSHFRLWEMIAQSQIPWAIICEDDVNLIGNETQSRYLNTLLDETASTSFDVMFLSWFRPAGGVSNSTHTRVQWCFCQLWAYLVSLQGVQKLLGDSKVRHMHEPVDVAIWESHCRGVVRNIVAYPPLTLTVGEHSDTRHIR